MKKLILFVLAALPIATMAQKPFKINGEVNDKPVKLLDF
jgi:hypothetical protein